MAKHLKALLSVNRVSGFQRHFAIPDDVHLSLMTESTIDIERTDEKLNRRLRINFGIPAIRHCYVLAKSSGRQGRYFLKAKDTDHHLVTMLASFGKRVDDVMVVVRGNWEFGEGKDRLDPMLRRKGEPDILYDSWSPAMTVSSICISILSMLSSSTVKQRPTDNDRYVKNCRKSPKETRWWFHDDKV
ncbi:hypothetical protein TEA_006157 [Camellia sinensis var. sinensis]|uniref:UBC core domain-containing protein n=1 Tax=Camellia sinensis var. sinensis TaxID=542762 RepID=A0A4S4DGD8_CAMSN|nr:hypothetical protein TEA_006157 [Camellia sinensis var. sinensis]